MSESELIAGGPPPQSQNADTARRDDEAGGASRAAVLRFIAAFIVLVMVFLMGYRYAMDSSPNIWYLFQVARHTAWTLGVVGDSAELEPFRAVRVKERRAELAAWKAERTGRSLPPAALAVSSDALSPWESWQHKAYSIILDGETIAEDGPIVRFVLKKGLSAQRDDLRAEIQRLRAAAGTAGVEPPPEVSARERELLAIEERIKAFPNDVERARANRGRQFSFLVVPDCGAIPSISIFVAAVLAFPALWRKRIAGVLVGVPILYAINVMRLATLGYVGAIDESPTQKWFNFSHEYVWQGIFIVFVVAVWMLWIEWFVRSREA